MISDSGKPNVRKVMLLDDDDDILSLLKEILEDPSVDIQTFNRAEAALKTLREDSYDLLISDWQMPLINGTAMAESLKRIPNSPPCIFLTAYYDTDEVRDFLSTKFRVIPKPFDVMSFRDEVFATLNQLDKEKAAAAQPV